MPFQIERGAQPHKALAPLPSTPLRRAWERATRTTDPMVLTGIAVAVAVVAVIVAIVAATQGHGGNGQLPGAAPASAISGETTPTESTPETTPTETTAATPTIGSSQVERVLGEYSQDYSNEDIKGLKSLFADDLERHDGSKAPEDLATALSTYERQFSELEKPTYSLSETSVEPGASEASATARYSITSQNGTVTGSITFHLVEQGEKLLVDKLMIEPSQ